MHARRYNTCTTADDSFVDKVFKRHLPNLIPLYYNACCATHSMYNHFQRTVPVWYGSIIPYTDYKGLCQNFLLPFANNHSQNWQHNITSTQLNIIPTRIQATIQRRCVVVSIKYGTVQELICYVYKCCTGVVYQFLYNITLPAVFCSERKINHQTKGETIAKYTHFIR